MATKDLHLAELHERAEKAGVKGFRMLEREQLIDAIESGGGDAPAPADDAQAVADDAQAPDRPARRRRRRGGRGRGRGRGGGAAEKSEGEGREREEREERAPHLPEEEVETEEVTGVLDRMPQGYGFLRLSGLSANEGDVYVSASQIRRCELWPGDEVSGPARDPREGERHRALVRVGEVNGHEPESKRVKFEDMPDEAPHRQIPIEEADINFGQRILVLGEPGPERHTLLRLIAEGAAGEGARLRILLDDERSEEAGDWEKALPDAEMIAPGTDIDPSDQIRAAELAVGHAKRRAESGADVVVVIDSLSRLALGYRDSNRVKRLFGAARELSEKDSGSVTVIASVSPEDEGGELVLEKVEGTEDARLLVDELSG